jgi:hypothetical protein
MAVVSLFVSYSLPNDWSICYNTLLVIILYNTDVRAEMAHSASDWLWGSASILFNESLAGVKGTGA